MGIAAVFQILCAFSIVFGFFPLAWHIKNQNLPAIFLIGWLMIYNACTFANTFIWPDDNGIWDSWDGHIYCDIQVKIFIASNAGQYGAIAAISRNLARIMSDKMAVVQTKAAKRRERIKELLICFGIPVWMMAVHYIVQSSRYHIVTLTGCEPIVDRSWPSIVLLFIWTPIASLVAAAYASIIPSIL